MRARIVAIVKTKRELVLQKYQLENGLKYTENEYLLKYELKFKCLENLRLKDIDQVMNQDTKRN